MEFRYTLTHESGAAHTLSQDPQGWDKLGINLVRDPETHGIDENITTPLNFHCEGAGKTWIAGIIDTFGVDTTISLLIEVNCNRVFEPFYTGNLDLMEYENTDDYFTCPITQTNLFETFLNRIDTNVDLNSLTGIDGQSLAPYTKAPFDFNMHSRIILMRSQLGYDGPRVDTFEFNQGTLAPDQDQLVVGVPYSLGFISPFEAPERGIQYTTLLAKNYTNDYAAERTESFPQPFIDTEGNILVNDLDPVVVDYNFTGNWSDESPTATNGSYSKGAAEPFKPVQLVLYVGREEVIDTTGTAYIIGDIDPGATSFSGQQTPFNFVGSLNIVIPEDHKVMLFWFVEILTLTTGAVNGNDVDFIISYDTADIVLTTESETEASTAKTWAIHEAFSRITESITGETTPFQSNLLGRTDSQPVAYVNNGCLSFNVITNGYNIRQFTDRPMFTNFKELFNTVNAINPIGYGYDNGVIRVEDIEYFYNNGTPSYYFENVSVTQTNGAEFYIGLVNIGFEQWKTEDIGGTDEVNTVHQYGTRIKGNKEALELLSSYITGSYPIEHTRRRRVDQLKDWQYDENKFLIATVRNETIERAEIIENFSVVTDILRADTIYNLRYTPARNFIRWLRVVNAGLTKYQNDLITFRSGEGNIAAGSTQTDNCPGAYDETNVLENMDFDPFANGTEQEIVPLWLPIFYEFEAPITWEEYKNIRDNRYNPVSVNGTLGFVWDLDYSVFGVSKIKVLVKL